MSVELLTTAALVTSAGKIAAELYPELLKRLKAKPETPIKITVGGTEITASPGEAEEIVQLLKEEIDATDQSSGATLDLTRKAVSGEPEDKKDSPSHQTEPPPSRRIAFGIDPSAVVHDARRRIDIVFKFNLAVAMVLAAILVCGIGGCVLSAVVFKEATWALAFAGISVADLLGTYVYKPLDAVNAAVIATQRLDTIHLRLREQLNLCMQHPNLKDRIDCQTDVWQAIQKDLATLSAPVKGASA